MNNQLSDRACLLRLCSNNLEAVEWIQIGRLYCHEIDDLIDVDVPLANKFKAAERACRIGAMALRLYSHSFYVKNMGALRAVMTLNTINYTDSVAWEYSPLTWQRELSDNLRHGWIQVVLVVADLCGGYECARNESRELWAMAYSDHHTKGGNAT